MGPECDKNALKTCNKRFMLLDSRLGKDPFIKYPVNYLKVPPLPEPAGLALAAGRGRRIR